MGNAGGKAFSLKMVYFIRQKIDKIVTSVDIWMELFPECIQKPVGWEGNTRDFSVDECQSQWRWLRTWITVSRISSGRCKCTKAPATPRCPVNIEPVFLPPSVVNLSCRQLYTSFQIILAFNIYLNSILLWALKIPAVGLIFSSLANWKITQA